MRGSMRSYANFLSLDVTWNRRLNSSDSKSMSSNPSAPATLSSTFSVRMRNVGQCGHAKWTTQYENRYVRVERFSPEPDVTL